jgi:hypothetical protein
MSTPPETGSTRCYIRYEDRGRVYFLDPDKRIVYPGSEDCPAAYATQAEADAALLSWCIERIRERDRLIVSVVTVTTAEE